MRGVLHCCSTQRVGCRRDTIVVCHVCWFVFSYERRVSFGAVLQDHVRPNHVVVVLRHPESAVAAAAAHPLHESAPLQELARAVRSAASTVTFVVFSHAWWMAWRLLHRSKAWYLAASPTCRTLRQPALARPRWTWALPP